MGLFSVAVSESMLATCMTSSTLFWPLFAGLREVKTIRRWFRKHKQQVLESCLAVGPQAEGSGGRRQGAKLDEEVQEEEEIEII
jgi:hypothetical protein